MKGVGDAQHTMPAPFKGVDDLGQQRDIRYTGEESTLGSAEVCRTRI